MNTRLAPVAVPRMARSHEWGVVDCDVHIVPRDQAELDQYLSREEQRLVEIAGDRVFIGGAFPRFSLFRDDAWPEHGGPPGSDYELLRHQLLDAFDVDFVTLGPFTATYTINAELSAAIARATNDWQLEAWIARDDRLCGGICVPFEAPDLAVQEIERRAGHDDFIQVYTVGRTMEPLGRRKYWPIYEAASAAGLPISFHGYGWGGHPTTGASWASYYLEDHAVISSDMSHQLASLVFEGVFDRYPDLKIVVVESSFAWMEPLMWRLDRAFALLAHEVPHLSRSPSEYIRDHVWITSQPVDEPTRPRDFVGLVEGTHLVDRLLFASDYPHWDFDDPVRSFPARLNDEVMRKVMSQNARSLFDLDARAARRRGHRS